MAEEQVVVELPEYELIYILHPDMDEDSILALNERVSELIAGQEGSVLTTELWGKRTLAYPIKKLFEGHYILHRLQMPPAATAEVERLLRFNENVIRYLIVRTDE